MLHIYLKMDPKSWTTCNIKTSSERVAIVVQQIKLLPVTLESHVGTSLYNGFPLPNQLLLLTWEKQWKMVQMLGPLYPFGRLNEAPNFSLAQSWPFRLLGSEPVNGWSFSLCHFLSVLLYLIFQINKSIFFKSFWETSPLVYKTRHILL